MKIVNILPFVMDKYRNIGLALDGTFAASAWLISDEAFESISGNSFSWMAPNGQGYNDHRDNFSRPTEEQVLRYAKPPIIEKAIEMGYIQETETVTTP